MKDEDKLVARALNELLSATQADRIVLWQIVGVNLTATHEFAADRPSCFVDSQLPVEESAAFVLEVLSRHPDDAGATIIDATDYLPQSFPMLLSLLELGDVRTNLVTQLRSSGFLKGFLELQQCGMAREWTSQQANILQQTAQEIETLIYKSSEE
jgi:GAF domain-containing protein